MNRLSGINRILDFWDPACEILIDAELGRQALKPLTRMLEFKLTGTV